MRVVVVLMLSGVWGCGMAEIACDPDGPAPRCPEGYVCQHEGVCHAYDADAQPQETGCIPYGCGDFEGECGDLDDGCGGVVSCPCPEGGLCGVDAEDNGSIATGDLGGGQVTWVHLPSALECDGAGAKALLDGAEGQGTHRLSIQGHSLTVPEDATILEVVVTLRRKKEGPVAVRDELVTLLFGAAPVGANLAKADAWPSLEWGEVTYRDADWDVAGGLTPQMVNDPSFGVGVRASKDGSHSVATYVDCATVLVRYACAES